MATPYWDQSGEASDQAWNTLTIAGPTAVYTFKDVLVDVKTECSHKWDVKEAPGTDGARLTNRGYTPARPDVTWTLWNAEQRRVYDDMLDGIKPKPGKTPPVLVIVLHPLIQVVRMSLFVVEKIPAPVRKGSDLFEVSLKLIEWFAQPKAVAKQNADAKPKAADLAFPLPSGLQPKIPVPPQKPSTTAATEP